MLNRDLKRVDKKPAVQHPVVGKRRPEGGESETFRVLAKKNGRREGAHWQSLHEGDQ